MHVVFGLRGIKRDQDEVIKFLETRAFPFPYIDKKGKERTTVIQGALRPIQLFEYVFPEDSKDEVLNTLKFGDSGQVFNKKMGMALTALRKMMGLKKPPSYVKEKEMLMPQPAFSNVAVIPIGVKYDVKGWTAPNGFIHERL